MTAPGANEGTLDVLARAIDSSMIGNYGQQQARAALAAVAQLVEAAREAGHPLTPDGYAAPFMYRPANEALRAALARFQAAPADTKEDA